MGEGWTGGASDIVKAESSGEDPGQLEASFLIFLTLRLIKQSNTRESRLGWHTVEENWSRDGPRLKNDNMRRGCRLQDRDAVQGRSGSWQHVVAHHRGRREAQLACGGIRKLKAFSGHATRSPAGTGRGCVSMDGGLQGQVAVKGKRVRGHRSPSPPCLF